MKINKKISIVILFILIMIFSLNILALVGSISKASGYYRRYAGTWEEIKGKQTLVSATDISIGESGAVYIIGNENTRYGGNIYRWNDTDKDWNIIPGQLARISIDQEKTIWGFNKEGYIWKGDGEGGWEWIISTGLPYGGTNLDIGAGDSQVFIICTQNKNEKAGLAYIRHPTTKIWTRFDLAGKNTLLTNIAVDHDGTPYAINKYTGTIYRGNSNGGWNKVPGYAWHDIAAGYNEVVILGYYRHWKYGSTVYKYRSPNQWMGLYPNPYPNGLGTSIDLDQSGNKWVVNTQGRVFKYN